MDLVLKLREKLVRRARGGAYHEPFLHHGDGVSFQVRARRLQLQVRGGVLDRLDLFIASTVGSLPPDLQAVLNAR